MALNERQKKFAVEYCKDFNRREAAIRAGYTERNAEQTAYSLLKKPEIQKLVAQGAQNALAVSTLDAGKVVQMIGEMASVDPCELFDDDGNLKPLNEIPLAARRCISGISNTKAGQTVKLEGRLKALELLGKYLKLWSDAPNVNIGAGTGEGAVNVQVNFVQGAQGAE